MPAVARRIIAGMPAVGLEPELPRRRLIVVQVMAGTTAIAWWLGLG
jgi:hypothetical protein